LDTRDRPLATPLTTGRYLPILAFMPRRKPGTLVPLETEILGVALSMLRSGHATFHGFGLAQTMREQSGSRSLTGHGTLYKALSRLEEFGLLTSRWENTEAAEGRPRRRLYELTGQGVQVAEQAIAGETDKGVGRRPRIASEPA
jgi:PadR family transcriptional regulator PadR